MTLSMATGLVLLWRISRLWDLPWEVALDAALVGLVVGLIAARIEVVLTNYNYFMERPAHIVRPKYGGFAQRSFLVAGLAAAAGAFRARHYCWRKFLNYLTGPLATASAIAWAGALWSGQWAGAPSNGLFAFSLPDQFGVTARRLPLQAVMAAVNAIWIPLSLAQGRENSQGSQAFFLWGISTSAVRGLLAFFRFDAALLWGLPRAFLADLVLTFAFALAALAAHQCGRATARSVPGAPI